MGSRKLRACVYCGSVEMPYVQSSSLRGQFRCSNINCESHKKKLTLEKEDKDE